MTQQEFDTRLGDCLAGLPPQDIDKTREYYREMIADCMEDGMTEEQAVASMGSMDEIVARILEDIPLPRLIKQKIKPRRTVRGWEIALLIIGSPLWLTLLIVAAAVVLVCYLSLWTVVVTFYAVMAALGAGALGGIAAGILFCCRHYFAAGLFVVGAGVLCTGLTVLTLLFDLLLTRWMAVLSKKLWLGIKRCFIGKERNI